MDSLDKPQNDDLAAVHAEYIAYQDTVAKQRDAGQTSLGGPTLKESQLAEANRKIDYLQAQLKSAEAAYQTSINSIRDEMKYEILCVLCFFPST